jgi:hypothetical protein
MTPEPVSAPDTDAVRRKRLNWGLPVAAVAAIGGTGLFAIVSDRTDIRPTASVSAPPLFGQSPAPVPQLAYRLSDEGVLVGPDHQPVPAAKGIRGHVDSVSIDGAVVVVNGWAVDVNRREPAFRIVAILDGRLSRMDVPTVRRPDVADALRIPSAETSGYSVRIPVPAGLTPTRLRIFALLKDGTAQELVYPAGYPFKRD